MDLFWLMVIAIGGMIALAVSINLSRDFILGNQNTFLFLEAIIVGMFVFLTIAMMIILYFLSRDKKPDVSIIEVNDKSIIQNQGDFLRENTFPDVNEK